MKMRGVISLSRTAGEGGGGRSPATGEGVGHRKTLTRLAAAAAIHPLPQCRRGDFGGPPA